MYVCTCVRGKERRRHGDKTAVGGWLAVRRRACAIVQHTKSNRNSTYLSILYYTSLFVRISTIFIYWRRLLKSQEPLGLYISLIVKNLLAVAFVAVKCLYFYVI